ncbi:MAG: hypothetical protein ABIL44_03560 [candidate division WOR-3 bacterium]
MKNANEIINDPIKSILFGKFYEKIVSGWLKERGGFTTFDGKPRIYWEDVEFAQGISGLVSKLNMILKKCRNENQFCTPDGFMEKDGKYYVWEAKNWPLWSEDKKPLNQLTDLLYSMPLILATKAIYRTKEYEVSGILFSWWSKPDGVEYLLKEINGLIAPRTFEIFYTADILEDCIKNKYPWYLQIVKEEKEKIDELFRDLKGDS